MLTFGPPPDGDAVSAVQPHGEEELPVAAEVHTAHAHTVGPLQDGDSLFGVVVPHVDGRRLADLACECVCICVCMGVRVHMCLYESRERKTFLQF